MSELVLLLTVLGLLYLHSKIRVMAGHKRQPLSLFGLCDKFLFRAKHPRVAPFQPLVDPVHGVSNGPARHDLHQKLRHRDLTGQRSVEQHHNSRTDQCCHSIRGEKAAS